VTSIEWLCVRSEHRAPVHNALARAWRGGAVVVADLPPLTFFWPDGAAARRAPTWPDVLDDWKDIYDEKLFTSDPVPVLAEEASGLGAEVLVVSAELGFAQATTAWYRKGALAEYEHVGGGAQVAWTPDAGLGRPFDGSRRTMTASASRRLSELLGADGFASTFERLEKTSKAAGEAVLFHAFVRLLGREPPPLAELAGMVAAAPATRLRLA
jgi:hypothetical protein